MLKDRHAYRVNCWKELVEAWHVHVDGITIVGVHSVVSNETQQRPMRYDKNLPHVNI